MPRPSAPIPRRPLLAAAALLALAGCATPYERCVAPTARDLRVVDSLIAETEANIARGYGIEVTQVVHTEFVACRIGDGPYRFCAVPFTTPLRRPVAIDRETEAGKLASLRSRRTELLLELQARQASCRRLHPQD